MFRLLALLLFVVSAGFVPQAVAAQNASQPARDAILVLDASGSMWARMDGKPQIVVAKDVILGLLDDLSANYRLGLMAYGHRRKGDCSDIEMMVPVGGSRDAIRAAVEGISPKGKTPMTQAVIDAAKRLKYTENQATVILVSDGKESCGMGPCAAAARLEKLGVDLTVHAIGFGLKKGAKGLKQVQCFADKTGGQFFAANNAEQLATALEQVSQAKPEPPATVEVKLTATNQKGGPVIEEGLVWTIHHGATGKVIHQSEPSGQITVEIPKGFHDVTVKRLSDGVTAEGVIRTGADGTSVTIPIIVDVAASLEIPESAPVSSLIRVVWEGPGNPDDYIGIFPSGDDIGDSDPVHATSTTNGNPLGLTMPSSTGTYQVAYISGINGDVLAHEPIEVTPAKVTLKLPASAQVASRITVQWTGPANPGDFIGIYAPDDDESTYGLGQVEVVEGQPVKLRVPSEPGTYEVRYVLEHFSQPIARKQIEVTPAKVTLKLPASAQVASRITVQWTGPANPGDFIGIYAPDDDESTYGLGQVEVVEGQSVKLRVPSEPGTYEVRYVLEHFSQPIARKQIEVTPAKVTLKLPASAQAASRITVQWTGPANPGDFIGIYAPDDDESTYGLGQVEVVEGQPVKLRVPSEPGTYEVRYVLEHFSQPIARKRIKVTRGKDMQRGVDRPGSDYHHFEAGNGGPKACMEACRQDDRCRAWAWTKAGFHSPNNRCWLKDEVPDPVPGPEGAVVSGVVTEQDRVSAHSAETSGRVPSQTSAVPASDLATLDPKYRLPPWEAWLQVQAKSLGAGWHTGWMSADLGVGCWTVVFNSDKPSTHGEGWLYFAEVERLRFRRMQYEAGIKNSAKLKQVGRLAAEKWQEVPMSAVRAQDEAHSCALWAD